MPSQKEFEESFREHLATLKTEEALGELKRVDTQLQDPALLRAVDKQLADLKTEEIVSSIRATRRKAHCSALHEKAKERESLKVAELRKLVKETRKERDTARQVLVNLSDAHREKNIVQFNNALKQIELARGVGATNGPLDKERESMKEVKPASNPHNRSFQGCLDEIEKLEDEMKQIARYLNDPVRIALSPRLRAKLILLAKEEHQDIDARLDRIMERL